jgi:cell division inhibitor SulA/protein ImuA
MRLEDILQRQPVWRGNGLAQCPPGVPTGFACLDGALPGRGWPRGELTELLGDASGIGELQLVLPALARLSTSGKRIVWLAPPHLPYAPALAAAGVDLAQIVIVRPGGRRESLWAAEQVLRAAACQALLAWMPRVRYAELQRLAAAAEAGGGLAFLFRPAAARRESSPASLRLALQAGAGELVVHLFKRRGAPAGAPLGLPLDLPCHALGRPALSPAPARDAGDGRRLGLPVHA